ncbi:mucin-5AC-like, partial [Varroa jacobsoni]|uniref:mucin-5AC-like n=1 Tax=Varroa jacobsoni TaxID=62625 RepID=UPI000BFA9DE8
TAFNYDVTVNPKPTITSVATGTTCTGVALNYLITSDVASNYSWTRAAVANITPTTGSGTTNPITETLTSTAAGPVVVRYVIIPTSTAGTCAGAAFNYDVTVSATAAPTVAITTTPGTTICDGTSVTFTTVVGSGGTPTYKWTSDKQAGTISTADSYSSSTLVDGEVITVEITSSLGCAVPKTATTSATMKVNANVTPSVTAAITSPTGTICPGANVTFTATPTNPGTGPKYQWYKGTVPGTLITAETNATYSTTGALNGDNYYVELTSNATCASPVKVNSTPVSVTVTPVPAPTAAITSDKTSICSGNPVVFTAVPGGTGITTPAPSYQWYIGSTAISAETNATFTTSSLTDPAGPPATPGSNQVHVTIMSNSVCTDNTKVPSNTITITVNPGVLPGSISTGSAFCSGTTPGAITELTPATGITGSAVYTWEQNTSIPFNPASWTAAVGTPTNGGKGFTPSGTVTTDISYRRTVTDNTLPSACQTATTNSITYTVIALPSISSAATGTICSKIAQNYTITSTVASSYVWSRGTVTGITNPGITNQISNPIVEALENTTSSAINVAYSIVPTSTTGSCVGATFTYTVTVNPLPKVQAPAESNLICSGVSHTYTITSDIGSTYSWSRASVANITPSTGSGTGSSITETLTNQTIGTANAADITVNYVIVPTSTAGSCAGPAVTYPLTVAVAAVPTVSVTANKTGICEGVPVKYTATGTATGGNPSYQWYQSSAGNPGGIPVGTNSATYTTTSLGSSTDKVWVEMTSNFPCIAVGSQNPVASAP